MRTFHLPFVALAFLLLGCTVSKPKKNMLQLREEVLAELGKQEGTFAVAFKDLKTGEELLLNEHESFHAASTMKTPVLIEAYKQAAEGKFDLTDSILVKNEFKSIVDGSPFTIGPEADSEQVLYTQLGQKRPLSELLYKMIIQSSNLATNIVIEKLDAKNVTQTMRALGAKDMQVLRGVEDTKAYRQGLNNTTTAYDLMVLFQKMAQGKVVSPAASQDMIKVLLDQKFKEIIPAKLPQDVKVAHKTGWITGVRHDSGIVFLPNGRQYVLVLLSKGIADDKASVAAMANVSEMIYRHVVK
ncbi:serine hydrolase [Rufibacter glacialis]|uniref:beta-lactamase n=1 Tax=Rufibacter glacialis TaxID=1259555 RepID=A0A5M8Q5M8_9BACT|nr:serine hydrolase [Rufibacter glacialis]KAA6431195.1 serine hydrolase [Rufibacter glacialis]GGK84870.1 serine hydrolase [Rufibacter glacialis]